MATFAHNAFTHANTKEKTMTMILHDEMNSIRLKYKMTDKL